ncbi:ABC transporter permease [Mahella australiensis]|uniref:ABC transporter permease protein n=1 Tax=Mahella australiensis (strain DSM 15567 / CIP 107919 / 50-1 BON) TaxID=697281 RepID=F3ZYF1_MAHA5|nr:ABC transporter permease [Mahella australiensis]AEE96693.1 protein of unknown function DUF214 [Mahella australiensis 50-1 BON]
MKLWQAVRLALSGIITNKMRSFLTMLGIVIGVASVIMLVSLTQGATGQITSQIEGLGSNLITVNVSGRGANTSLSYDDAMALGEEENVKAVAPVINSSVTVKYGSKTSDGVSLTGTNDLYEGVRNVHVQSGRFILPIDVEYRQKIAVIGYQTAQDLFGFMNPLGQYIKINGQKVMVVGVLEEQGGSITGSGDNVVFMPITAVERMMRSIGVRTLYIQASSSDTVDSVTQRLEGILTRKFRDEDSVNVFSQTQMLSTISSVTNIMSLLLGGIAGISLLVGGIGIMNIMLVSVTERTREIGIRKAVGAKKADILWQFLIESVVLTGVGGVMGILLGIGGGNLLGSILSMPTATSLQIILLSFGFAVGIGILFGIYPANRAANLNPIEALRYE